jgi:putative DNA primase/helicase
MNHRKLLELSKWDFPVHSGNAPNLTRYLAAFENVNLDSLPTARSTSRMGPHEGNVFLWGQATLSKAGPSTPLRLKAEGGAAQIAAGFRSHGHLADWLSMVEDIQDFPAALLAVYAALTPPLLYFLPDAPNFAVDWSGRTSIGKTTVLRLAGSCWGIPDERQAGPVGSWDATYCGVEERARLVTGMPLILDDTKNVRNSHSIAQTIYHVIGGQGRSRSSRDVSLRHQRYWKTVLLSSGEAPLTSFTQDGGTRARVIPVYNAPFGADPERGRDVVERLRHKMAHSYGHAGPALVRWLLQHADQHDRGLHCWHAAAKERWAARATDGVTGRMSHYLAVLDVCRQVAKHSLDLHIDSDDMLEFTWEAVQEATSDSDRGAAALRLVASWMVSQQSSFYDRSTPNPERPPPAGWLGSWERGDWTDAGFLPDRLQTYLENHDFSFIEITSDWQRRGWLKVNKGRNQRPKRDIAGKRARCIVVKHSAFVEVGEFEERD